MPRGAKPSVVIPTTANYSAIGGSDFVAIQAAARLGRVHPVALSMGKNLIKTVGTGGAVFQLATPDMKRQADGIEKVLKGDLRKVAKALEPNKKVKVKTHRDGDRIVFWFAA